MTIFLEKFSLFPGATINPILYAHTQSKLQFLKMSSETGGSLKKTCQKCGVKFGVIFRRHKCKVCALHFCHKCSSNKSKIPQFGHHHEVRVCDACHEDYLLLSKKGLQSQSQPGLIQMPIIPPIVERTTINEEKAEDDEEQLELAISLSLEEHRRMRGMQVYEEQELTVVKAISLAEIQQQLHANTMRQINKTIEEHTDNEDAGFYENY